MTAIGNCAEGVKSAGDAALHVAGAAPVELPVFDHCVKGVSVPSFASGDGVAVRVVVESLPRFSASEGGVEVRPLRLDVLKLGIEAI